MDSTAPHLMCVATHHKAGTIWLKRIIKALSQAIDVPWALVERLPGFQRLPTTGRVFCCSWIGAFPEPLWQVASARVLHLIRDPRDILLSGASYHAWAGPRGERYLHEPRADLGGKTYQQHLNSLPTQRDKLLFEMDNKHRSTLQEMLDWPYGDARCFELTYEALMADHEGHLFRRAMAHLGLTPQEQDIAARLFWDNSLFGGLADPASRNGRLKTHIENGRAARWKTEMPRSVGRAYAAEFGPALIALGYETDNSWVSTLPEDIRMTA